MTKLISQREARELRKRVKQLEDMEENRRNRWSRDYPGGVHIGTVSADSGLYSSVETARKLRHAVVAIADSNVIRFYALPLAENRE